MNMKHINILIAFAALAVACNPEVVVTELPVKSIAIVQGDQTLTVGQTVVLTATVDPESSIVDWASSDEAVVRVASSGKAVALSAGRSVITAAARDKSASITVTVTEPASEPALSVTGGAEKITAVSALLQGRANVESMTGVVVGVQYSLYPGMLTNNSTVVEVNNAENNYSARVMGLEPNSTYYYRSVLVQGDLTYVGETKEFKTKEVSSLLTTQAASGIEVKSAVVSGSVDLTDVEYETISYGICWGMTQTELDNDITISTVSDNVFSYTIAGLRGGKTYWYQTYVVIDGNKLFGAICSFTTAPSPYPQEPVDLGLSVKWASCNLGASKPEEQGDYYAWGEVEPYYISLDPLTWKDGKLEGYEWASYKWGDGTTFTKYNNDSDYGEVDDKLVLDHEDDASYVLLEGEWRTPTIEECYELVTECDWEWSELNGVLGCVVSGNGNSIFLPAAGYRYETLEVPDFLGEMGLYWSSSLRGGNSAYAFMFVEGAQEAGHEGRVAGFSIRPVLSE